MSYPEEELLQVTEDRQAVDLMEYQLQRDRNAVFMVIGGVFVAFVVILSTVISTLAG